MLDVAGVSKSFGGFTAVRDCSLQVDAGQIVGLIGPNGAGKTTLFEILAGSLRADAGSVRFGDREIQDLPAWQVSRSGVVRTFQIPQAFTGMTVIENLLVAAPGQLGENFINVWTRRTASLRQQRENEERAWETLEFLRLEQLGNARADSLSGGQLKLLELGRSLMCEPKLLLLDEPVAGVNGRLIDEIGDHILALRQQGMTLLVVEHNLDFLLSLTDRVYVMAHGSMLADGPPDEVRANPHVIDAYLGAA